MKRLKNLKTNLKLHRSNRRKWERKTDIFLMTITVIILISIPVLMAAAVWEYASFYCGKDAPGIRRQINEETVIQGKSMD